MRCPHGIEVRCIACMIFDRDKQTIFRIPVAEFLVVFLVVGVGATLTLVHRRITLDSLEEKVKVAESEAAIAKGKLAALTKLAPSKPPEPVKPPRKVPKGYYIEVNSKTGKYRACTPHDSCGIYPLDTYEKAVEVAWAWVERDEEDKYWKRVK